jgi:hypothetical protein
LKIRDIAQPLKAKEDDKNVELTVDEKKQLEELRTLNKELTEAKEAASELFNKLKLARENDEIWVDKKCMNVTSAS